PASQSVNTPETFPLARTSRCNVRAAWQRRNVLAEVTDIQRTSKPFAAHASQPEPPFQPLPKSIRRLTSSAPPESCRDSSLSAQGWPDSERAYPGCPAVSESTLQELNQHPTYLPENGRRAAFPPFSCHLHSLHPLLKTMGAERFRHLEISQCANRLSLIAGPCVIENEKLCLRIAANLQRVCRKLG